MVGYLYIIQSLSNGNYYMGSSLQPEKRLEEHNLGKVRSTRKKGPWILRFSQEYPTATEARRIEYKLKKFKSRKILNRIVTDKKILTI